MTLSSNPSSEEQLRHILEGVWHSLTSRSIDDAVPELLSLIDAARIKLPKPYLEEQILALSYRADQEYMRGFNRCLEDIADMNRESATAEQPTKLEGE